MKRKEKKKEEEASNKKVFGVKSKESVQGE